MKNGGGDDFGFESGRGVDGFEARNRREGANQQKID